MANPFDSTVGLKGVTTTGEVPIWINDISGMSTELVGAVADREDYATGDTAGITATWERVRRLGLSKLYNLIEGELSKSADFQYVGSRTGLLTGDATGDILLPAALYSGYGITADVDRYSELYLGSISFDTPAVAPVTTAVKVFSAKGEELFTKDVTVQPGYNVVSIDTAFRSQFGKNVIAFVGIDVTALPLSTQGDSQDFDCREHDLQASSVAVSGPHSLALWTNKDSTGIMLEACVRRSLSDVLSRYVDRLGWCYAHLLGSLLMTEKLASVNVNLFTNTNRLFTEQLETRLMDEAKSLLRPVTRSMVKDLRPTAALQPDSEYQQGYFPESFV